MSEQKIEELNLLTKDLTALKSSGIETIDQLLSFTESDLLKMPRISRARVSQIKEHLWAYGDLKLKQERSATQDEARHRYAMKISGKRLW
ncbi:DNA-directed RNA polymerase subunit alpha C-terminal domain-containing protein [uncultured Psychrobacter sp.]|uniref:DNA-directed RNA polymerase subunit alpha C-terminal domain-containing protein n=1 Tax=uncultured Psychrobacter sp. TaxID=259303 RepID=UPI00261CB3B6|nr:DNA-directed RNA polymerase subunit alpha C-terminal domain-containing protein [uncultured Psychrobacter sp.]